MKTEQLGASLIELLVKWGAEPATAELMRSGAIILGIIIISIFANYFTKKFIIAIVASIIKKTKNQYDDIFMKKKVFNMLSHIVPALFIYFMIGLAFRDNYQYSFDAVEVINFVQSMMYLYMIVVVVLVFNSFLNAVQEVYTHFPISKEVSIRGFIQVVKIIIILVAIILVVAVLIDKRPGTIFAGLGAIAAVLLLVFKDTILGFIASIQLQAYKMVKAGDWISMPSHNADGTVLDISLNTVKVQNWDKTITTIPTYQLVAQSFINWKGMEESGGRRIKRSISLDMKSVRFVDEELLTRFKKVHLLKDYIQQKELELAEYNTKNEVDNSVKVNGRRMTNLGTFRKYVEAYLRNNPNINLDMTFLVRHLQPTETGLPIEIYVFSKDQRWAYLEGIQADIFDHILAILPEFDLRVFQYPSGYDLANFKMPTNK